ncbi:MAG TPA: HEAT repeat domain-containing protein [Spirochaetia bacterium]|nr:HEAT repeat domain-containing protein [Spirochaetales bacterium]HRY79548.1 HEAT repeat domain-containing protein [Spirochaetia bacterium]
MERIVGFLAGISTGTWIAAGIAAAVAAAAVLILSAQARFRRFVRTAALDPAALGGRRLSPGTLALRERYVIRRARGGFRGNPGPFPRLPATLGYGERWMSALESGGGRGTMSRVLEFLPDTGLFACFRAALRREALGRQLLEWTGTDAGAFALRRIALSGPGRDFDGPKARALLAERLDEVRELLGDPEWAVRVFAVRILLGDGEERTARSLRSCLADPHPLVRRLIVESWTDPDRKGFYEGLYGLLVSDSVLEVRKAARARIRKDFADLYSPDPGSLGPEQVLHFLELLDPADPSDEGIAFKYLEADSPEERLAAAECLQAGGALARVLETAELGDAVELERRFRLLDAAAELQVTGFLSKVETIEGDGAFHLAARILARAGDRKHIATLAKRWFSRMGMPPYTPERLGIYDLVLAASRARGGEDACELVVGELNARRGQPELASNILMSLEGNQGPCVFPALQGLFLDPTFELRAQLRAALLGQPREQVVPLALSLVRADRVSLPRVVRKDALYLIGELKLTGALQRALESLPLLDADEISDFAPVLAGADMKAFERKARVILDGADAPTRAAVIAALPAAGSKAFLADVKAALRDADPDIRVAAARALAGFHEGKALASGGLDLLRDPVERVRFAASAALAMEGGAAVLQGLRSVLDDPNEVDDVKRSLIEGLGRADDVGSLDLLADILGEKEGHREEIFKALAARVSKRDLERLVERFKDATGDLKTLLSEAFRRMGETGERTMAALLEEDIASLKPYIVQVLESRGYVEARILELKHRDPKVRRDAAAALSNVGSLQAFRGIVLAARDPDPEVRVAVTRALERLAGPEGASLLAELEADPNPRVRKYVLWALERVKAKNL